VPRQGNNSYIFPGVGLGVVSVHSTRITDEMFMAAARTLAEHTNEADLAQGSLYPPLNRVLEVSAHIAAAVAEVAYRDGLATLERPDDLVAYMRSQMYDPHYVSFV
jgi:malate dehydrogenase (oxaloacetate-decarboxylating)(NADP+)